MSNHSEICSLCRHHLSMCICASGSNPLDTLEDAVEAKANREMVMVSRTTARSIIAPESDSEYQAALSQLTQTLNNGDTPCDS